MPINEIFSRPTVKEVIFQVTYPNLFFIESRIGDIQMKLIDRFPESKLLLKQHLLISQGGDITPNHDKIDSPTPVIKIWQFSNPNGYVLNIANDSLDISSNVHKTYNNSNGEHKLRDIIEYSINAFLSEVRLPKFLRMGMRYINSCPLPNEKSTTKFKSYYDTSLPLKRYSLETSNYLHTEGVVEFDDLKLKFIERVEYSKEPYSCVLDFDCTKNDVNTENYLLVADRLHERISDEFMKTVKTPVIRYMRG